MLKSDFFCVLNCFGLEHDFVQELRNVPYENLEILGLNKLNPFEFEEKYFSNHIKDVSIDPNANVGEISPNNFYMEATKPYFKLMTFYKIWKIGKRTFPDFSIRPLLEGYVYFHDSTKGYVPYCIGASCLDIIQNGRPYGEPLSLQPKRSDSYVALCTEFLMDMSQEFAGAVAFTDFLIGLAWYTSKENLEDKYVENRIQSFVHVANNKFRVGGDSPFSNISVNSKRVIHEMFDNYIFPDGRVVGDFIDEIMRVQQIFLEFMYKGRPEAHGLPYKFPVVTANFKKENLEDKTEVETDWFEFVARLNHKGCFNINMSPKFAMCCRLNLEMFKFNSFGDGGIKLGSFRVINVNLPRLAIESYGDTRIFFATLKKYLVYAHMLLAIERDILKEKINQGFLKFFNLGWYDLDRMFFGTLSFHGLPDAIEYLIDKDITDPETIELINAVINEFLREAETEIDFFINVEQAPSESATNTMALINRDYRDFYSNQFVPLEFPISLKERIDIEGKFSDRLTGGSMCFINLDAVMDEEQSLALHKYVYNNSMINQWCPNYGWSVCEKNHSNIGDHEECPNCGSHKIEHYERVVGYFVNRENVNKAREIEMLNRVRHQYVTL